MQFAPEGLCSIYSETEYCSRGQSLENDTTEDCQQPKISNWKNECVHPEEFIWIWPDIIHYNEKAYVSDRASKNKVLRTKIIALNNNEYTKRKQKHSGMKGNNVFKKYKYKLYIISIIYDNNNTAIQKI